MQFLASALPGFRDLRAPLVAGYLWLLFAWLLVGDDFESADPVVRDVVVATEAVGKIGVLTAASVASVFKAGVTVIMR